jgi:NAD(P)-dependent dehydrogenase (short-subunit alcohol dehydrogenase family)
MHCDVVDWDSQVNFFKGAIDLSKHGGIDVVVANAGIPDKPPFFEEPEGMRNDTQPVKPNLTTIDVNLTGVLYTAHLALFYLPRNPTSSAVDRASSPSSFTPRDRHLLLLGSIASLTSLPGQALYGVSKHGVLGLFRSLRGTSFVHGIRVNMLCPYFIDTPIISSSGRHLLAGIAMGKVEDVVDAATRFVADTRIVGRSLVVGPKLRVEQDENGDFTLLDMSDTKGGETAVWEAYAEDYETCDIFARRMIGLFATAAKVRGWTGFVAALVKATFHGLKGLFGR